MQCGSNPAQLKITSQASLTHRLTMRHHPVLNTLARIPRGVFTFPCQLQAPLGTQSIRKRAFVSWYFVFFFISGFCSVLYELVWLRLAMAQFGVTTAMVSIVLSVFMAGLGLGSWASGKLLRRYKDGLRFPALRLYG